MILVELCQQLVGHAFLPVPLGLLAGYAGLRRRIMAFAALPIAQLDRIALQHRVDQIGLDLDQA